MRGVLKVVVNGYDLEVMYSGIALDGGSATMRTVLANINTNTHKYQAVSTQEQPA